MKTTLPLLFMVTTIFVIGDAFWLPPPTPHLMKSRSDIVKIKDMDILLQKDLRKIIKAMLDDSLLARQTNPIQAPLIITTGMVCFLNPYLIGVTSQSKILPDFRF